MPTGSPASTFSPTGTSILAKPLSNRWYRRLYSIITRFPKLLNGPAKTILPLPGAITVAPGCPFTVMPRDRRPFRSFPPKITVTRPATGNPRRWNFLGAAIRGLFDKFANAGVFPSVVTFLRFLGFGEAFGVLGGRSFSLSRVSIVSRETRSLRFLAFLPSARVFASISRWAAFVFFARSSFLYVREARARRSRFRSVCSILIFWRAAVIAALISVSALMSPLSARARVSISGTVPRKSNALLMVSDGVAGSAINATGGWRAILCSAEIKPPSFFFCTVKDRFFSDSR